MADQMTNDEFKKLEPGDIVKHIRVGSIPIIVAGNYGERITAVATFDLTNSDEWVLISKASR